LPFRETSDVNLGPAGENLAVVLHKLEKSNGSNALDSVVSGLKGAIPGFLDIKTTQLPVEGKWAFQIIEEKIKGAINPDSVSDGTIRLLALLVIASWSVNNSSLIVIEEPETGLHPHLSEQVIEILRTASERCQVIVTTHNPTFLDYLEPEEVILCDKKDGFTYVRRASDITDIKAFQKHFRLGELWEQGVLGGVP
jgi:predicted ATPase